MRDESSAKIIITIVVVAIACLLGGLLFMIFNAGKESVTGSVNDITKTTVTVEESKFTQYDGAEITGSQVVSAITSLKGENVYVSVDNGKSVSYYLWDATLRTENPTKIKELSNKKNLSTYANPSSTFLGEVIRDNDTDAIIGISFVKQ